MSASPLARRQAGPLLPYLLPLALLAACGPQGGAQAPHAFPPAPVAVVGVAPVDLPVEFEYVGQTAGSREVEIRARVTGILQKRNYTEGATVRAGQSLFTLDPAPYQTAAAKAEADLASAEARMAQAERQAARLKPLIEARAVSQKDYDDALSAAQVARADMKGAQARLGEARLNIGYARVESPLTGIASRSLKSEGALISGPDVLLTTVSQVHPIFVNFGIPGADQQRIRRDIESGAIRLPAGGRFDVQVKSADGTPYGKTGKLDFSDVRINPSTGTSDARAELPNPDTALRPGQFVKVRLTGAVRVNAIKVPQRAVLEGPAGKFVYVVMPADKGGPEAALRAEARPVEVGEWAGDAWVIRSGLKAGERVITDGVMKIGPGAPVSLAPPAGAAPPAGGGDAKSAAPAKGDGKAGPDAAAPAKK